MLSVNTTPVIRDLSICRMSRWLTTVGHFTLVHVESQSAAAWKGAYLSAQY
jgi:hypothetical protein